MLVVSNLESQIKGGLSNIIPAAIKQCKLNEYQTTSDIGNKLAQDFADTFDELVSANLAKIIANAIDAYIKNAQFQGTIITAGSMVTQTAAIMPAPSPVTAGAIPNTLKIL